MLVLAVLFYEIDGSIIQLYCFNNIIFKLAVRLPDKRASKNRDIFWKFSGN